MIKKLMLSAGFFLVCFISQLSAFSNGIGKPVNPFAAPTFTTSAPTANVVYDRPFTYNFSATDTDLDGISFYTLGTSQLDANYNSGTYSAGTSYISSMWQSFTSVSTGLMISGSIYGYKGSPGGTVTAKIYVGTGTGGTVLFSTTFFMSNSIGLQTFSVPVSANVVLTAGQVYTIEFSGTQLVSLYNSGNPYSGGQSSVAGDNNFQVYVNPLTTTPATSWLNLVDNNDGTGSLTGTPTVSNVGAFSETLIAKAGTDYIAQSISFNITAAPVSVANVMAIANNGAAELKWSKSTSGNFGKYYIYGGIASNPTTIIDSTESINDTTKTISDLTNGTPYHFRIREKTSDGYLNEYSPQDAAVPVNGAGNVLTQNGTTNNVTAPSISALNPSSALTVEAWVKLNSLGTVQYIVSKGTDDLVNGQFGILVLPSNVTQFHFRNGGLHRGIDGVTPLTTGKWYHVAGSWDGTTMRLYLNGKLEGSFAYSTALTAYNSPLQIGRLRASSYMLNGSIDEVRVWNYGRTQAQIRNSISTPLRGDESGLISLYHFDEPTNSPVAFDYSPNNNNASVTVGNFAVSDGSLPSEPAAPTGLSASAGNGGVSLKWNKNSEQTVSKYYIYGGTTSESTSLLDSTLSVSDTTKLVSALINGTQYFFRLKAIDDYFQLSDYSSEKSAIPADGAGNMLTLNGENEYAEILNDGDFDFENGTVEFWVSPNWTPGMLNYNPCVIALRNSDNVTRWSMHIINNMSEIDIWNGSLVYGFQYNFSPGVWYHIAMVRNAGIIIVYVNGVQIGITVGEFGSSQNLPFHIGTSTSWAELFPGSIDEVRMWSSAKTAEQLLDGMLTSAVGTEDGLIGLWQFNESEGSVIYDGSSNGNHGTLYGNPIRETSEALTESSLPVELLEFSVTSVSNSIVLNWETATESNNAGWEIERRQNSEPEHNLTSPFSKETEGFSKIGFVAGKGTTTEKQSYQFSDSKYSGRAEYRLKQIDTDGKFSYSNILSVDAAPASFDLSQNYPNPFNPNTTISYQLSAVSKVGLTVFDLLGREVAVLVNEEKPAGNYSVNFSALNLPSGVYFYKLTAGNFSKTKKMTLLK